jgi:spore maturation protein CgeB
MLGACYITEMAPGLEDLYEIGTEIETYRDARELVEKCTALIADPSRRRKMRALGQHRAMAQHTIGASLDRIATMLGIRR